MESQIAPPISGCSTRAPGSKIPKLSSSRSKLKNADSTPSPRVSKIVPPKTITSPIRKSVSQPTSVRKPSPKTSYSESAIPKPHSKALTPKSSDSTKSKKPTRIVTPRTLTRPLSKPASGKENTGLLSVASEIKPINHTEEDIVTEPVLRDRQNEKKENTGLLSVAPEMKPINHTEEDIVTEPVIKDRQNEKSLEDISDAIFERVCGVEKIESIADTTAPPCLSTTDSDSSESENRTSEILDEDSIPPHVPPLDLNLLDDYDALLFYEAMKEEELSIMREKDEELERLEAEDSIRLAEEKQHLLDDMQSLKNKLEKQQQESSERSDSEKEELETKLESKQKEVDSVNEKFAELLDEQQKILLKVSEQGNEKKGSSNAFLIAVIVVLIGILIFFWNRV